MDPHPTPRHPPHSLCTCLLCLCVQALVREEALIEEEEVIEASTVSAERLYPNTRCPSICSARIREPPMSPSPRMQIGRFGAEGVADAAVTSSHSHTQR